MAEGEDSRRVLRVTFVAPNYAPSIGGAQQYLRHVAEHLVMAGHQVEVLTTDALISPSGRHPGRIDQRDEVIGGVQVRRYRTPSWLHDLARRSRTAAVRLPRAPADPLELPGSSIWYGPHAPGLAAAIQGAVRSRDVVVGVAAPYLTLILPTWVRPRRAKLVALPFLHLGSVMPSKTIERALRACDLTVASTEFESEHHRVSGVAAERVVTIAPGTDPDAYPVIDVATARGELGLPDQLTVGYVGRLAGYKGVDVLLDAAPTVWGEFPDATVLIAGSSTGWSGHRTHESVRIGGDRLVIREDFAGVEHARLLAACDVVVMPSREESFGLGVVEAWASRRPVIVADHSVSREVVDPGANALVVALGDPDALAAGIVHLFRRPEQAMAMGAAGRHRVESELSWAVAGRRWNEELKRVATLGLGRDA